MFPADVSMSTCMVLPNGRTSRAFACFSLILVNSEKLDIVTFGQGDVSNLKPHLHE